MTMNYTLPALAAGLLCAASGLHAQTAGPDASPHSVTGTLSLVSDYRFRGISQSWRQPAVQAGIDYTHASGLYLGNWNSSVSSNSYNNGASLESDLYGGYRFPLAQDVTADAGVLFYLYPGARLNSAPATPSGNRYDNTELYFGIARGAFNAKLSYAVTDYFGLNGGTAAYAYWSALPARGSSRGTTYLDLNYGVDLGHQLTLNLHLGHTAVRHYGELSYSDYKLGLARDWSGFTWGLAVVGTQADAAYYQVGDSAWLNPKRTGRGGLVLSAARTF